MYVWTVSRYYGPMYWGFVVATMLLGTTFVQGYIYLTRNNDRMLIQSMVSVVIILDFLATALMATTVFHYFIQDFGDFKTFADIPSTWCLESVATALVTSITQAFFSSRIYLVMRQYPVLVPFDKLIPISVLITALGGLGSGIAKTVLIYTLPVMEMGDMQMLLANCFEEGFAALSDTITTITFCYILASTPGGVRRIKFRLRQLFFFMLTRGVLVTLLQIGSLAAFASATYYLYWVPFYLCKSKIYTNTLLAMLNSRSNEKHLSDNFTLHRRPSMVQTPVLDQSAGAIPVAASKKTSTAHPDDTWESCFHDPGQLSGDERLSITEITYDTLQ
ncbi:hypothetical protein HYDPIDRAFT_113752 [Hydnomerulius pinastri MD-312]|uniref:DUF6534 domain-containing protein n=1 Tax=Hydnomerulius pinastri MD-312 TaxID=994086 RepID=A0A0C9WEA4_9AGAM|nr:hypothetical protein HYDPIDRAFT_113752 [Hydnomerulius pinastri MD-312]